MKQLVNFERFFLWGHIFSMLFGLAGLLIVLPHPELIASLSDLGQTLFRWSMSGGGVAYIILGAAAVAIYAYRILGTRQWLAFMVPSVLLSLGSELMGTSTGFPFGEYGYLSGLGYKIAGLVPFTIPLSWFYMGFACYLLARVGLEGIVKAEKRGGWLCQIGAVVLGTILLTSWDFALDPAMSQGTYPFWHYGEVGSFFGTPYRNFAGWMATGALFMTIAALFWKKASLGLSRKQLGFPLVIYLSNVIFSAIMTIADAGLFLPVGLSVLFGVLPALILWGIAPSAPSQDTTDLLNSPSENEGDRVPATPVGAMPE
jgi:putative membrane protein